MPIVQDDLDRLDGGDPSGLLVALRLVGANKKPVVGYTADGTLISPLDFKPAADGSWSKVLPANTGNLAGTRYRVVVTSHTPAGAVVVMDQCVNVTDTPATQQVRDILDDPPATPESSALMVHKSDLTAHGVDTLDTRLDALEDRSGFFTPADHGLVAWAYDPSDIVGGNVMGNGDVRVAKLPIRETVTLGSIRWGVITSDADPVAGQCQIALYDSAGQRVHAPIDIAGDVTTVGAKSSTIPGGVEVAPPFAWLAILVNFTTGGTFAVPRATSGTVAGDLISAGLGVAASRYAQMATGQTALPASFNPAALVHSGASFPWCAVA